MTDSFDLNSTYVHLTGDGVAETIPVTEEFWPQVIAGKRPLGGWLVTRSSQTRDWPTWEMHPAGHEILILLSGRMDLILDEADGPRRIVLETGSAFVVPPGTWHTAKVAEVSELLAITAGQGTRHAETPPETGPSI